jgi:hypothetical protein
VTWDCNFFTCDLCHFCHFFEHETRRNGRLKSSQSIKQGLTIHGSCPRPPARAYKKPNAIALGFLYKNLTFVRFWLEREPERCELANREAGSRKFLKEIICDRMREPERKRSTIRKVYRSCNERNSSWTSEHLVDSERSERIDLVIRDREDSHNHNLYNRSLRPRIK